MKLYTETLGAGPDLVLLHGWGLHAGVWESTAAELAKSWRVTLVDLPGHGRSPTPDAMLDLDAVTQAVAESTPRHATWMGWSLGGMIAAHAATSYPSRINKLVLITSSMRFITGTDWPHAMTPPVLSGFAHDLENDYQATLERFVSLQIAAGQREILRELRLQLSRYPSPSLIALRSGLEILIHADLRADFAALSCPTLLVYGARDKLVPAAVGADMRKLLPSALLSVIPGAAHAPFLSHAQEFLPLIEKFLHEAD